MSSNMNAPKTVLAWRHVQLHMHMSASTKVDLDEWKIHRQMFYAPHTPSVKPNVVLKGKHNIFSCLCYLYWSLLLYFPLPILVFLNLLLTHFFLVIDLSVMYLILSRLCIFILIGIEFLPIHGTLPSNIIACLFIK